MISLITNCDCVIFLLPLLHSLDVKIWWSLCFENVKVNKISCCSHSPAGHLITKIKWIFCVFPGVAWHVNIYSPLWFCVHIPPSDVIHYQAIKMFFSRDFVSSWGRLTFFWSEPRQSLWYLIIISNSLFSVTSSALQLIRIKHLLDFSKCDDWSIQAKNIILKFHFV